MNTNFVDSIISCLNVNQKTWNNCNDSLYKPDLTSFPIEFDYLTRCLHALGPEFFVFRLIDTNKATMESSIIYTITNKICKTTTTIPTYDVLLNECGLNALIVCPDKQNFTFIHHSEYEVDNPLEPFVILYKSYDNLYYPLECLNKYEKQSNNEKQTNSCIFYRDNIILQQYLSKI